MHNDNDLHATDNALRAPREQIPAESPDPSIAAPAPTSGGSAEQSQRKRGAQPGNQHRYKHGLRQEGPNGSRRLLVLASSPPRDRWMDRLVDALRQRWEQDVIAAKGKLSRVDERLINSAARWELHALRAGTWLRREHDKLTYDQRIAASREAATATDRRNSLLARLGIDTGGGESDPWASFAESATAASDAERLIDAPEAENGNESRPGASQRP